jgi:hypothetical protein
LTFPSSFAGKNNFALQASLQAVVRIGQLQANPESTTGRINDSVNDLHLSDIFSTYGCLWDYLGTHPHLNGGYEPDLSPQKCLGNNIAFDQNGLKDSFQMLFFRLPYEAFFDMKIVDIIPFKSLQSPSMKGRD